MIDPFGAAALLPLQLQAQPTQQGTGTADHLTLLRLFTFSAFFELLELIAPAQLLL